MATLKNQKLAEKMEKDAARFARIRETRELDIYVRSKYGWEKWYVLLDLPCMHGFLQVAARIDEQGEPRGMREIHVDDIEKYSFRVSKGC